MADPSPIGVILAIAGGVALLLWAARMVRTGIERAYGAALRRAVTVAVRGRARAVLSGAAVALALQSATATALLSMSLLASGVLPASPALALMLGADLGSALAVQVLSLDLRWLSPLLLLVGVGLFLGTDERRPRQVGRTLVGLGLLLLSLRLISEAAIVVGSSATLRTVLESLASEPLIAFVVAGLVSWAVHSSVATVLLIASLAAVGVLDVPLAFALVLGANAGAGLVPVVLTMRSTPAERRVPLGNLLMRTTGALAVLAALPFVEPYRASLGLDALREVVIFHLAFNLALVVVFAPLTPFVAALTAKLIRERPDADASLTPLENPTHLDPKALERPALALAAATREVLRMADWVEMMLRRALDTFDTANRAEIVQLSRIDDQIDAMNARIKQYLVQLTRNRLDEDQSRQAMEIAAFTMKLEHIGDIIDKNLLQLARKHVGAGRRFSDDGWRELTELHERALANLTLALNAFVSGDIDSARQLMLEKERFGDLVQASNERHMGRLRAGEVDSLESSASHLDVIRDLKQINSLLVSTAYPILEGSGELLRSRLRETDAPASKEGC